MAEVLLGSAVSRSQQLVVHWLRETRAGAAGVDGTDRETHDLLWQGVPHHCRGRWCQGGRRVLVLSSPWNNNETDPKIKGVYHLNEDQNKEDKPLKM